MKTVLRGAAIAALLLLAVPGALAEAAAIAAPAATAPAAADIHVGWLVDLFVNYVMPIAGTIGSVLGVLIAKQCHDRLKINLSATAVDMVTRALTELTGYLLAKLGSAAGDLTIKTSHPEVAAAANQVIAALPREIKRLGWTPDVVAGKLVTLVGTAAAAPPNPAAPAATK